jgi:hypothetical protein
MPLFISFLSIKYLDTQLKLFAFYLSVSLIFNIISEFLIQFGYNNLVLSNIYNIIEFSFLIIFYSSCFEIKFRKPLFLLTFIILVGTAILLNFLFNSSDKMEITAWAFSSIVLTFIFLFYLYKQYVSEKNENLFNNPTIWITIGLLIYFGGTFFLFLAISLINFKDTTIIKNMWQLNNLFVIITNILLSIGIWKSRIIKRL